MSLMNEYIDRKLSTQQLESELLKLISRYNQLRNTYLFVYAAGITQQPIPALPLDQSDFYMFRDLLAHKRGSPRVDVYIETRGGSGETAEDIVRFLHNNFDTVSFVVSGESKSAGTLIVLSGDEILMTETGSLGPIDAQMKIGRSVISAYDYMEWVQGKQKQAQEEGRLNPFDATMVAQITPGELGSVFHGLRFAQDLVVEWLVKYKFKNWAVTETRQIPVTPEMKRKRAKEIAKKLTDHSRWRSHGRSIQIEDLANEIGLKVTKVDDTPDLADVVYRIQTVCRMLLDSTSTFKMFATQDNKIFRQAVLAGGPIRMPQKPKLDVAQFEQKCPKCGTNYKIYAKLQPKPQLDSDFKKRGFTPFPRDAKIKCNCGFEIDLLGIKRKIESQAGKPVILDQGGKHEKEGPKAEKV